MPTKNHAKKPRDTLDRLYLEVVSAEAAPDRKRRVDVMFGAVLRDRKLALAASKDKKYLEVRDPEDGTSLAHIISPSASHPMVMNIISHGSEVTGMANNAGCKVENTLRAFHGLKQIDKAIEVRELEHMLRIGNVQGPVVDVTDFSAVRIRK